MLLFLFGIIWGRILNQIAYIFVHEHAPMSAPRACSTCHYAFAWYQRIPLFSYIVQSGRCPGCRTLLSPINFFIELLTGLTICLLYYNQATIYFLAYFIFFSGLIITIRTDLETMLIVRCCTVGLIPLGILFSILGFLPLSLFESIVGSLMGCVLLYGMMKFFSLLTGKQGMGLGDIDLLAFVGSFTGPWGCWISLLIGSTLGSLAGCLLMLLAKRSKDAPIPFGPFLALGAIIYVLWQQELLLLLFNPIY